MSTDQRLSDVMIEFAGKVVELCSAAKKAGPLTDLGRDSLQANITNLIDDYRRQGNEDLFDGACVGLYILRPSSLSLKFHPAALHAAFELAVDAAYFVRVPSGGVLRA